MLGEIGILNVGAGDTKIVFDKDNPQDMIRASRIVRDMIQHGYALLIAVPGTEGGPVTYRRAYDFDEGTCEYIIADLDPVTPKQTEYPDEQDQPETTEAASTLRPTKTGRTKTKRVHASATTAVAVPRTAGG